MADGQRGWIIKPQAEEREEGPREGGWREGVEVGPISCVVEGDIPCVIVQEDPQPTKGLTEGQGCPWGSESMILSVTEF